MISIIHYISAIRRLKESEKTVMMMGGESECQPMILAQRDYIKMEVGYYKSKALFWSIILAILPVILIPFTPNIYGFVTNIIMSSGIK